MISRFPSSPLFRRLICCLLALATVCLCLAPALVQPALAIAGFDDATLAVGLLFCSWAGVTFATNQGAATAVTSFLNSSVNGLKACSEVASKYVVDGSLALVQGVQDAFNSVLSDINSTFQTPDGSTEGAIVGSTPVGVPLQPPFFTDANNLRSNPPLLSSGGATLSLDTPNGHCTLTITQTDSRTFKVRSSNSSVVGGWTHSVNYLTTITSLGLCFLGSGVAAVYTELYKGVSSLRYQELTCYDGFSVTDASIEFLTTEEQISFKRIRKQVAKEISDLHFAQANPPAPNPTDPTDPSESPDPSTPETPTKDSILAGFKDPMFWGLMGMIGILKNETGYDASKVDPEALLKQLQDLLSKTQTDPEPTPTEEPQPEPEPSEATKPTTSPDSPTDPPSSDSSPGFDDMKLPGLRDFFPFCIPFDLYAMMKALCADPEAPKFTFATSFLGQIYTVEIDLAPWESVATMIRYMVVAIYIVSLAAATRKFIKW